jgi:hypothetical protein
MGWGSWGRKSRDEPEGNGGKGDGGNGGSGDGGDDDFRSADARLPDAVVLGVVAERLTELSRKPWRVEGSLARGPGSLAVALGEDHTGSAGHLDLVFLLNVDRPDETDVADCSTGFGGTTLQKVERAVDSWIGTTASTVIELLEQQGRLAEHLPASNPEGYEGWHAIQGGITGWGVGDDHEQVRDWAAEHPLLPALSWALGTETLPREHLVGIKVFFGSANGQDTAEVRVNGQVSPAASRAILDLPWPRAATGASYARTFALLVHTEEG